MSHVLARCIVSQINCHKFNERFSDHFGRMGSLGITIMELCKQKAGWLVCDSGYQYYQLHWSYMICMNDQWSAMHCWENKMKLDGPEALIDYYFMANSSDVFLQILFYSWHMQHACYFVVCMIATCCMYLAICSPMLFFKCFLVSGARTACACNMHACY